MLVSTVGPFAKWGEPAVRGGDRRAGRLPRLHGRAGVHPPRARGARPAGGARRRGAADRPWATTTCRARSRARWRWRRPERGGRARRRRLLRAGRRARDAQPRHGGVDGRRRARADVRLPRRRACGRAAAAERVRSFRGGGARAAGASRSAAPSTSRCRPPIRGCGRSTCTSAGRAGRAQAVQLVGARDVAGHARARRARGAARRRRAAGRLAARARAGHDVRRDLVDRRRRPTTAPAGRWPRCTSAASTPTRSPAGFLAWAAAARRTRACAGAGAVGPVEAFGLEALERGCAEAGLERVRP